MKIGIEEKTEKYPFHRDEGIRSILNSRLQIFKDRAAQAAAGSKKKNIVMLPDATISNRKMTVRETLKWLDDLKALQI